MRVNGIHEFDGFPIILRPPTESGRLYPRYINSVKIFMLESRVSRGYPYGFTIDGSLTLDIDADRLLASAELKIGMPRWKLLKPFPEKPARTRPANIVFTEEAIRQDGRRHRSRSVPVLEKSAY